MQRLLPQPEMPITSTPLGTISALRRSRMAKSLRRSRSHFFISSSPPIWSRSTSVGMYSIMPVRLTSTRFSSSSAGTEAASRALRAAIAHRQLDVDHLPLELFGHELHRRADDHELTAVEARRVEIAQPAADLRKLAQGIVEVREEKDAGPRLCGHEVERRARAERLAAAVAVAAHALREAPQPQRRRGREERGGDLAQERDDATFLGGAHVDERTARLDDLPQGAQR